MRLTLLFLILVFSVQGLAETDTGNIILIHAGTLISDVRQTAKTQQSIIIEGEKIKAVKNGFVSVPGARLFDLSSSVVLPGMIDAHIHLQFSGASLKKDLTQMEDGVTTLRAYAEANRSLQAGFTTLRDMAGDPDVVFALRDAINQGIVKGPRIVAAGPAIMPTGGGIIRGFRGDVMSLLKHSNLEYPCDGADNCRRAVRELVKRGADFIKIVATASITAPDNAGFASQMTLNELKAIVDTAHALNRKVSAHAHGRAGLHLALEAGVDSIEHGTFGDRSSVRLYKKTGAYLVPTPLFSLVERAKRSTGMPAVQRDRILEAGDYWYEMSALSYKNKVNIAFGSDINVGNHGKNADYFRSYRQAGMSNADIIYSATGAAADLLGMSSEIGSIEAGKNADIIASKNSPLESIDALKNIHFVMKGGEVFKN